MLLLVVITCCHKQGIDFFMHVSLVHFDDNNQNKINYQIALWEILDSASVVSCS